MLCLGDTFDKRKTINFNSLDAAKEMWFDPLRDRGVTMNMLIGNHDIYFKNTLKVNAPELLLQDYGNINIIDLPGDYSIGGRDMCCIPWVCDESRDTTRDAIETSAADICVGISSLVVLRPYLELLCLMGMTQHPTINSIWSYQDTII